MMIEYNLIKAFENRIRHINNYITEKAYMLRKPV